MCVEPHLQPVTGEVLAGASSISTDGARLNVAANGFWIVVMSKLSLIFGSRQIKESADLVLLPQT